MESPCNPLWLGLSPVPGTPLQPSLAEDFSISSSQPEPLCLQPETPAELPSTVVSAQSQQEPEERRRRGPKGKTQEQKLESRERRIERNRHFARQNRERKKQYIAQLESQIVALTAELSACRRRLAEYEAAANRNVYTTFDEFYRRVRVDTRHFSERLMLQLANTLQTSPYDARNTMPVLKVTTEERTNAINLMAETVVDFTMPLPVRYIINLAEEIQENIDGGKVPVEDDSNVLGQFRRRARKLMMSTPELLKILKGTGAQLKRDIGKYFRSLGRINKLMLEMDRFLVDRLVPRFEKTELRSMLDWIHLLMNQPPDRSLALVPVRIVKGEDEAKEKAKVCCGNAYVVDM